MGNFPSDNFGDFDDHPLNPLRQRSINSEEYRKLQAQTQTKEGKQGAMSEGNIPHGGHHSDNIRGQAIRGQEFIPERWRQIYYNPGSDFSTICQEAQRFFAIAKGYKFYIDQLKEFTSRSNSSADDEFWERNPWILDRPDIEDDKYFENWGKEQSNFRSEFSEITTKNSDILQYCIEICSENRLEIIKLKTKLDKQQGGRQQTSSAARNDKEDVEKLRRTCQENLTVLEGLLVVKHQLEKKVQSMRNNEDDVTGDTELENALEYPNVLKTYADRFTGSYPDAWRNIPSASQEELSRINERIQDNHTQHLVKAKCAVQEMITLRDFHHWKMFWKGLKHISEHLKIYLQKCERNPSEEVPAFVKSKLREDDFILKCGNDSKERIPVRWQGEFTVDQCKKKLGEIKKDIEDLQSGTAQKADRLEEARKRHEQFIYWSNRYKGLTEIVKSLKSAFDIYKRDYSLEVQETEHEKNINDDSYIQQCGSESKSWLPYEWKYISYHENWEGKVNTMKTTVDQLLENAQEIVKSLAEERQKRLNFQYILRLWIGHNLMYSFLQEKNRLNDWTEKTEEENKFDDDTFLLHYADIHPDVDKKEMCKRASISLPIRYEDDLHKAEEKLKEFCNHMKRESQTVVANFESKRQIVVTARGTSGALHDQDSRAEGQGTAQGTSGKAMVDEVTEAKSEHQRYTNLWKGMKIMLEILEKHLADCRRNLSMDMTKTSFEKNVNDEEHIQEIGENSSTRHLPHEWSSIHTLQQYQKANDEMKHACGELTEKLTKVVDDLQNLRDKRRLEEVRKQQAEELESIRQAYVILQDDYKQLAKEKQLSDDKGNVVKEMENLNQDLLKKLKATEKQFENEKKQLEKEKKRMLPDLTDNPVTEQPPSASEVNQANQRAIVIPESEGDSESSKETERLADKGKECERIREFNSGLQDELKKANSLNEKYKVKYHEVYNNWQSCIQVVQQRDQQIQRLQFSLQQYKYSIDNLESQVRDGKGKIQSLEAEKEKLLTRLSKIAGAKLTQGNAAITDLSDANRPMKIAEKYSELYDNEWTDALEELLDNGADDNRGIAILLEIIVGAYKFCSETAEKYQIEMIQSATSLPVQALGSCPPHVPESVPESCDSQRSQQSAGAVQKPVSKTIQLTEEQKQVLDELRKALCPQLLYLVEEHYMSILNKMLLKEFGKLKPIRLPCDHNRNGKAADLSHEETDGTVLDIDGKSPETGNAQIKQTEVGEDVDSKKSQGGSSDDVTDEEITQQLLRQEEEHMKKLQEIDEVSRDATHDENSKHLKQNEDYIKRLQDENQATGGDDNEEKSKQLLRQEEEHMKKLQEIDEASRDATHDENSKHLTQNEDYIKRLQDENQATGGDDNEEKSKQLLRQEEEYMKNLWEMDQTATDTADSEHAEQPLQPKEDNITNSQEENQALGDVDNERYGQQQSHQQHDYVNKMTERQHPMNDDQHPHDGDVDMRDASNEKQGENKHYNQDSGQNSDDINYAIETMNEDDGLNQENDQSNAALNVDNVHSKVTKSTRDEEGTVGENKIIEMVVLDRSFEKIKSFAKKCATLCWFMRIKDPPLYMMHEVSHGFPMDTESFKHYTQSGKTVKFLVWPALFLHKGGALLAKGVAQPMKKAEEREFRKNNSTPV